MIPSHSLLFVTAALLVVGTLDAQTTTQEPERPPQESKPVIVTATRRSEDPFEVPYTSAVVTQQDIERRSYRTTPQALRDIPGIMVQETAHGHGSPYIRGFTSFRTLFLVDGVRLNNSVFRPGPNQYWNTVDPLSLDRLEVVKGPSSVLYGSDAIGGTVHAITKSAGRRPKGFDGIARGSSYLRYSTAEDSFQGRADAAVYTDRLSILIGGSVKSMGDLEGGDSIGTQPYTGYDETNLDLKVELWLCENSHFVFLHQRVDQNDVPRTHRTIYGLDWRGLTVGSDLRREFDQNRELTYLQYHMERGKGVFDTVRANVSFHRQEEERERVRGNGDREFQGFEVGTLGAFVQFGMKSPIGHLTFGADYYHDDVDSFLRRLDNPGPSDWIQGPVADDATYDILDVYLQDEFQVTDSLAVTLGARFSHAAADANSVRDPVTGGQISLEDDWSKVVGSARFLWSVTPETINIFGGVSQGFRAPNLSDLTRFDSARSNEFEIPATNLDPENYLTYEIGVRSQTDRTAIELTYFYTDIDDQILRYPTGNTNGAGEDEVTKDNIGDGYSQGIELGFAQRVCCNTTVFGNGTWIDGKVTNYESPTAALQETYLTRMMPLTMQLGLRWEEDESPLWAETVVVHAEDADKLSFNDQRDTSRIPPGGTPSYTTWHARAGWEISDNATLHVLIENITDVDYRVHGSGLNRPGRNFVFGLSTTF